LSPVQGDDEAERFFKMERQLMDRTQRNQMTLKQRLEFRKFKMLKLMVMYLQQMAVIVSQIWGKILPWVRVSQWMKSTQNAETSPAVISALESITREVAVIHNHIHSREEKIQSQRNDI